MRAALLASILLAAAAPAPQPIEWRGADIIWSDLSGSPAVDWTNHVIELRDGKVFAAGFVNRDGPEPPGWDLIARKYAADGKLIWSRRIGGDGLDAGWASIETADGRIAITGPSASGGAGGLDAWLLVLDADGKTLVDRRYGGANEDFTTGIAPAPDGGFILTGWTQSFGAGGRDVLVIRTDRQGNELWRKAFGTAAVDRGFYVRQVAGGYVIAGVTGQPEAYDFQLMKVDDQGRQLWVRTVGGPGNDPTHGLVVLPDGRIRLIGYTQSWGARDYDLAALTFSADGELLRHELLGSPGDDRAQFAATARDGTTWITGYTKSFSGGDWDVLLAKVRPDGSFEPWLGALATPADDNGSSIASTSNGDLLISGYSAGPSAGAEPPDGVVIRLDPSKVARRTEGVLRKRID